MKKLLIIPLLLYTLTLSAQRAQKGQHAISAGAGLVNSPSAFIIDLGYSNYRSSGIIDINLYYNGSKMEYQQLTTPLHKYIISAGYKHRLLQNYRRNFLLYAGAAAGLGYGTADKLDGIEMTTNSILYTLIPAVQSDWFISKQTALTLRAADMIFISSDLDNNDLTLTIGLKYIIK